MLLVVQSPNKQLKIAIVAQLIGRLIILMMSVKAFVEIRLDMRIAQAFFSWMGLC